jgi:hypothetical protein
MHSLEQFIWAYLGKQLDRVVNSVYLRILVKVLTTKGQAAVLFRVWIKYLIECADGGDINDSVGILKVWGPGVPVATGSTHIEQMPGHMSVIVMNSESVLCDPDGLDASMQDIIHSRDIIFIGNSRYTIQKATVELTWNVRGEAREKKYNTQFGPFLNFELLLLDQRQNRWVIPKLNDVVLACSQHLWNI